MIRHARPKRVNAARRKREFARAYGSEARVAFVRSLMCVGCLAVGRSENAHVGRKGAGAGRKADYDQIAPLCGPRIEDGAEMYEGCHRLQHRGDLRLSQEELDVCAADTEAAWLAHLDGGGA